MIASPYVKLASQTMIMILLNMLSIAVGSVCYIGDWVVDCKVASILKLILSTLV